MNQINQSLSSGNLQSSLKNRYWTNSYTNDYLFSIVISAAKKKHGALWEQITEAIILDWGTREDFHEQVAFKLKRGGLIEAGSKSQVMQTEGQQTLCHGLGGLRIGPWFLHELVSYQSLFSSPLSLLETHQIFLMRVLHFLFPLLGMLLSQLFI